MGKETLEVRQAEDKTWSLEKPPQAVADKPTLDNLMVRLSHLRGKEVIAFKVKDLKQYGLDEPAAKITVRVKGADNKTLARTFRLGKPVAKDSEERYAVAEGESTVVALPADLCSQLLAPPLQFRNRNLANLEDLQAIQVQSGEKVHAYFNISGTWKLREPRKAETDPDEKRLKEFLKSLTPLRADQLVTEKAKDLADYGLKKPRRIWVFVKDDEVIQALLIGAREKVKGKDGPRCYAKLVYNSDVIFLMDPTQTAKFEGDFRKKMP
jgi:hypothetical protein